jgi:2-polyprenyl-6-methoxyphenol hydroxylase-like FAD-dependent oxidoreductase
MVKLPKQAPILVVGGGPVGFVAALRLVQAGIPVVLIEKDVRLQHDLRASTFHPPTLEMLDELDLTAGLLNQGLQSPTWQIRLHETHEKAEFDLNAIRNDTRYPFRLQVEQSVLCALAAERANQESLLEIRMDTELISFQQDSDKVVAQVRSGNGQKENIETTFMIAADGSRSTVREQLNLSFAGLTYPETTILVTTDFAFEEHLPGLSNVNYVWYAEGTFSLLHLPNIWRCSLYPLPDESGESALRPERIEARLQQIVPCDEPYAVRECRPYRIHQRILDDYRVGRILLAGDAAHLNSPSGGMGMNGGIHDAFNIADKLADIISGKASIESLDLYTKQRQPIAKQQILQQAHQNRTRMQQRDPEWRREELSRLQTIAANTEQAREFLLRSSMITGLREAARISS